MAGWPSIIAPNRLQREFTVEWLNTVWITDISCIRTWQGWVYLAVIVDFCLRRMVACSMKPMLAGWMP